MKTIRLVIIDDERSARNLLKGLLKDIPGVQVTGEAESVDEAIPLILKQRPDLLLLDIQMPNKNGFDLVELLLQHHVEVGVIFVTAFEEHAIRAIKASAFDYLLKPVKKSEIEESLAKYSAKLDSSSTSERFSQLIYQLSEKKKLKFRNRTGFVLLDPDEILFCKADSNYTILELESGKQMILSMNLGKIEETLPQLCFARISRSVIVNLHYLTEVDRKNMNCEIINQTNHVLPVSSKYVKMLEEACDRHFSIHG